MPQYHPTKGFANAKHILTDPPECSAFGGEASTLGTYHGAREPENASHLRFRALMTSKRATLAKKSW